MERIIVDNRVTEAAFEKYADMLLRIAYQNTRSQSDSEDAVQFAFMKMLEQKSFKDENNLKAWLIRVTINRSKNILLSPWRKRNIQLSEDLWEPFDEKQTEVFDALSAIPQKYRICIYLYYYEGYSINEIADILSENANTISSRLSRGRKMLKQIIIEGEY